MVLCCTIFFPKDLLCHRPNNQEPCMVFLLGKLGPSLCLLCFYAVQLLKVERRKLNRASRMFFVDLKNLVFSPVNVMNLHFLASCTCFEGRYIRYVRYGFVQIQKSRHVKLSYWWAPTRTHFAAVSYKLLPPQLAMGGSCSRAMFVYHQPPVPKSHYSSPLREHLSVDVTQLHNNCDSYSSPVSAHSPLLVERLICGFSSIH